MQLEGVAWQSEHCAVRPDRLISTEQPDQPVAWSQGHGHEPMSGAERVADCFLVKGARNYASAS